MRTVIGLVLFVAVVFAGLLAAGMIQNRLPWTEPPGAGAHQPRSGAPRPLGVPGRYGRPRDEHATRPRSLRPARCDHPAPAHGGLQDSAGADDAAVLSGAASAVS